MPSLIRPVIRFGVISALGLGASYLVVESVSPGSARAVVGQARSTIAQVITNNIDDPIALRAQLKDLEAQYPQKIAQVRSDLNELQTQKRSFERELGVAERVVSLAEQDLGQLNTLLTKAEEARRDAGFGIVRVRYEDQSMDMDAAYAKASRIGDLRDGYALRAQEISRDLGYLADQEGQLVELLAQLESEHTSFRQQLWQLDQQVDAIARNERMIDLMEKRQATLDEVSPYTADSLDQVRQRLSQVRTEQEQRMQALSQAKRDESYVDRARTMLEAEIRGGRDVPGLIEVTPPTIEIGEEGLIEIDDHNVAISHD